MTKTLPSSFPRRLLAAATVLAALVLPLRPPPVFAASDPSSLAARIAAAPAGSTVTVDPGSYPQLVLKSLSWSCCILAYAGERTLIRGTEILVIGTYMTLYASA